jgi:hypothetical protein
MRDALGIRENGALRRQIIEVGRLVWPPDDIGEAFILHEYDDDVVHECRVWSRAGVRGSHRGDQYGEHCRCEECRDNGFAASA